jgi:hypothetical protein
LQKITVRDTEYLIVDQGRSSEGRAVFAKGGHFNFQFFDGGETPLAETGFDVFLYERIKLSEWP